MTTPSIGALISIWPSLFVARSTSAWALSRCRVNEATFASSDFWCRFTVASCTRSFFSADSRSTLLSFFFFQAEDGIRDPDHFQVTAQCGHFPANRILFTREVRFRATEDDVVLLLHVEHSAIQK